MERIELVLVLAVFALVFGYIFLTVGGGKSENNVGDAITNELLPEINMTNESGAVNITPQKPANVCTTITKKCPDGAVARTVKCTSGAVKEEKCSLNPYNKDLSQLPSNMRYYGLFKCYWDVRGKYPYGSMYDPFTVCQQQVVGWKESCDCAAEIQQFVSENGKPKIQ